jgi:hypothetical protein
MEKNHDRGRRGCRAEKFRWGIGDGGWSGRRRACSSWGGLGEEGWPAAETVARIGGDTFLRR